MEAKQEPTRKNKQAGELITCKGRLSPDNRAAQKSHTTPQFALDSDIKKKSLKLIPIATLVCFNYGFECISLKLLTKETEKNNCGRGNSPMISCKLWRQKIRYLQILKSQC